MGETSEIPNFEEELLFFWTKPYEHTANLVEYGGFRKKLVFLREFARTSTQIIKRKRICELAHKDAREDCSVTTLCQESTGAQHQGRNASLSHIGVSNIYILRVW